MSISWYMDSKMVIHLKITNLNVSVFSDIYPQIVAIVNQAKDSSEKLNQIDMKI